VVGEQAAGEPQLGVGGDAEPGPAVDLLGQTHPGGSPAEGVLGELEGVLDVKAVDVGPPAAGVQRSGWSVRAAWSAAIPASRAAGVRRTPQPHGPYWQWSTNINGRTVTRRLTERRAALYREWIANDRRGQGAQQGGPLAIGGVPAATGRRGLVHLVDEARYSRTCRQPQTGMIFRPGADVPGC
jgi:hypothetical protein